MVRLMNEVKLPDKAAILAYVERLEADEYDPDDFEFDGPDSFELQANHWVSRASESGLFGEGNLTLWPVMDGDFTVGGFILTIDVGHSPQLRSATSPCTSTASASLGRCRWRTATRAGATSRRTTRSAWNGPARLRRGRTPRTTTGTSSACWRSPSGPTASSAPAGGKSGPRKDEH